jgi:hypothetical protein
MSQNEQYWFYSWETVIVVGVIYALLFLMEGKLKSYFANRKQKNSEPEIKSFELDETKPDANAELLRLLDKGWIVIMFRTGRENYICHIAKHIPPIRNTIWAEIQGDKPLSSVSHVADYQMQLVSESRKKRKGK